MAEIPTTADEVDYDFHANASLAPGSRKRALRPMPSDLDPGHLATDEEWAEIVARAEGAS